MSFHDAYLRLTPYELAVPGAGSEGSESPESAASLRELGALAFHVVPFRRAGCVTLLLDVALCRALVGDEPAPEDARATEEAQAAAEPVAPPGPAGYVQLPRHLFWAQAVEGEAAEPVDGFFWTVAAGQVLHLLLATGMRDGRSGLSIVPVAEAPLADSAAWVHARIRDGGEDFATTLPGGELRGLHSFVAAGEVLKLAARLFAHLAARPASAEAGAPGPAGASPAPSRLAYRRVTLHGAG